MKGKPRKPPTNAELTKQALLDAVAEALAKAPAELDSNNPKATIAVNGSTYIVHNTVDDLSELQARLLKLKTKVKAPGVSKLAIQSSAAVLHKQSLSAPPCSSAGAGTTKTMSTK